MRNRMFAWLALAALAAVATAGCNGSQRNDGNAGKADATNNSPGVSAPEDLMREHGVLRRIMLVYDDAANRLEQGKDLPVEPLAEAAKPVRSFVENYHEKLEEDFIFPRFEKAQKLTDLVHTLLAQHEAGRRMTDRITQLATREALKDEANRKELAAEIRMFTRMYRPHAAREDTVLFPALGSVMSPEEFATMGDKFEDREDELFGEGGFEKVVEQVAGIEKAFGIYNLEQFTPAR